MFWCSSKPTNNAWYTWFFCLAIVSGCTEDDIASAERSMIEVSMKESVQKFCAGDLVCLDEVDLLLPSCIEKYYAEFLQRLIPNHL